MDLTKLFAVFTMLFFGFHSAALTASADSKRGCGYGKGYGIEGKVMHMQKKLELSDDQANKVYDIYKEAKGKDECGSLETFTDIRKCRETKRSETHAKVSAVLNPEQKTKLDEMKKDREARMENWGKKRGMGQRS